MLSITVPSTFLMSWRSASGVMMAHALTLSPRNADPRAKATRRGCCALILSIREESAYIGGSPLLGPGVRSLTARTGPAPIPRLVAVFWGEDPAAILSATGGARIDARR